MPKDTQNKEKPLIIAHRGASAYYPENTIKSFSEAVEMGVDMIELDVRVTKDDAIVVIHDDKVDRLTKGSGEVEDFTLEELRQFKVYGEEQVPTLNEVVEMFSDKVKMNIELKVPEAMPPVYKLIKDRGLRERVIIQSFHTEVIKEVEKLDPAMKTGILTWYFRDSHLRTAKKYSVEFINPHYRFLSKKSVGAIKAAGFKVLTWTVNTEKAISKVYDTGVDGIISNKPDLVKQVINK